MVTSDDAERKRLYRLAEKRHLERSNVAYSHHGLCCRCHNTDLANELNAVDQLLYAELRDIDQRLPPSWPGWPQVSDQRHA